MGQEPGLVIISVSGLRGVVGEELGPLEFAKMGRAFGRLIGGGSCAAGRDTRPTGGMAMKAVVKGLLEQGCRVLELGVASTPAIFREAAKRGLEGGLSISASHNPPEWNGVKFSLKGGRGLFEEELEALNRDYSGLQQASPQKIYGRSEEGGTSYSEDLVEYVGRGSCSGLKVALDPGGGAGALFLPKVFRELGCRVMAINDSPGIFPRKIDPLEDELAQLSRLVMNEGCALGFAFDCDGDRAAVVDGLGRRLSGDHTLLLCFKHLSDAGRLKDVALSVDTSLAVEELVKEKGGKVFYSKVGEPNVVRVMLENHCSVGGEGSSSGVIVSEFVLCRDGALASALIAKAVAEKGSLKEVMEGLSEYHQLRRKVACRGELGRKVVERLAEREQNPDRTDGMKVRLSKGSWALVRQSATEDVLRISVEAETAKEAEEMMDDYYGRVVREIAILGEKGSLLP